uniref:Ig-like domain-containing protein n=1 Tax=Tetraodon nigroviridis TaxID=99883 RepID=H3BW50_TETNG
QTATMEISPSVKWKNKFKLVKPGETLMLPCFYKDQDLPGLNNPLEEKPRLVCASSRSSWKCYNSFENNPRFRLDTNNNGANLTITDLEFSDSANILLCKSESTYDYRGSESAITQSPSESAITLSPSEFIHSVGTGTPNCSVHTGTCDGEHTVYWFRDSGPSELSFVYRQKGRNNQCEKKTNSCFYSLSLKNLNISQTGTYYCAVEACGHILFGNGTKLVFEARDLYKLCKLLIHAMVVVVLLSFSIFIVKKRNTHRSLDKDSQPRSQVSCTANTEGEEDKEDNLHYAAVRVNQPNTIRMQRNNHNECVYSAVRQ